MLSQVDVDRLEAKLADGTITSRLEAAPFAGTRIGEHVRHLPIPGARNPTPYLQPPSSSPPEMPILRRLFGVTNPVEDGAGRRATGVI